MPLGGFIQVRSNIKNTNQGSLWVIKNWGSVYIQDNHS